MDTNTIMLIALAILVVLSALGIWLANRGSGVEDPHRAVDPVTDDEDSTSTATTTTTTTKTTATTSTPTDRMKEPVAKSVDTKKPTSNVKVVNNTKKTAAAPPKPASKPKSPPKG